MKLLAAVALLALIVLGALAACGSVQESRFIGVWDDIINPFGTDNAYSGTLTFTVDGIVTLHVVSLDLAPPGCTVTTDLVGNWQATGEETATLTTFWTSGIDAYSGCTAVSDDGNMPYDSDKLAAVSGSVVAKFSVEDSQLTLPQSYMGQSYDETYERF